ncbi:MAG: hypothetical protein IPL84_04395 [Chitinophagaceae bacterium]|nr:hypothetical protein [Chitinophagaceae bacterium]
MKIKAHLLIVFLSILILPACQKDIDVFIPDAGLVNGPDSTWHTTITASMPVFELKSSLLESAYTDSIMVNANTATLLTPSGLLVTFPPNCCATSVGQTVTGKVDVDIKLVNRKGNMIRQNKPSTTYDSLLVTAAHIYIKLKKDGQQLQLRPNVKINIRYAVPAVNTQMHFFAGTESSTGIFNWLPNPDTANNKIFFSTQSYEISTNQLGWISTAYKYDLNSTPAVQISADIPYYFTNANTIAFTVFNDLRSVAAMHGDFNMRKFVSGKLPVGKNITVVVISKLNNDYYLGYQPATTNTQTTSVIQQVPVTPIKRSLSEILSYLSSL